MDSGLDWQDASVIRKKGVSESEISEIISRFPVLQNFIPVWKTLEEKQEFLKTLFRKTPRPPRYHSQRLAFFGAVAALTIGLGAYWWYKK